MIEIDVNSVFLTVESRLRFSGVGIKGKDKKGLCDGKYDQGTDFD